MGLKVQSKTKEEAEGRNDSGSSDSGEPDWFEELVSASDKEEAKLEELVEDKVSQYDGLVGRGAAAVLVARSLDLELEDSHGSTGLDICNLVPGMNDVVINAEIVEKTGVNSFDGGKVANWVVEDDSGRTQVAFWGEDVDELYDSFEEGDRVRIQSGYTKQEVSDYQSDRYNVPAVQIGDNTEVKEVQK